MEEKILSIIMDCCNQHNQISERKIDVARGVDANLYGIDGVLDSLSLVSLIVSIEQGIEDATGIVVTLADARAASQEHSPFKNVAALASYAKMRVLEEQHANG